MVTRRVVGGKRRYVEEGDERRSRGEGASQGREESLRILIT